MRDRPPPAKGAVRIPFNGRGVGSATIICGGQAFFDPSRYFSARHAPVLCIARPPEPKEVSERPNRHNHSEAQRTRDWQLGDWGKTVSTFWRLIVHPICTPRPPFQRKSKRDGCRACRFSLGGPHNSPPPGHRYADIVTTTAQDPNVGWPSMNDAISYPPRGLSRDEAARYVGVGSTLFDEMVADGRMPRPKQVNSRAVWDRVALDIAFTSLPDTGSDLQKLLERSSRAERKK